MAAPHTVRPAAAVDAAVLAALDAVSQINPWKEAQFATLGGGASDSAESMLVAEISGQVVGYVVYAQVLDEASVYRIAVHSEHRGLGLGQALLEAALQRMRFAGMSRCLLEVRQSNTVARRLYAANGFGLDGVRKNYYPAPAGREDALLMSRTL